MISLALITAYVVKDYRSGALLASLAFALPALATDLTVAFLIFRVYRHAPIAMDDTWPAFLGAMLGTHSFVLVHLAGVSLTGEHPVRLLQSVCMALLASSYPLVVYTLLVLGGSWSILPEAKKLVTVGPYKWSRHPLYVLYVFWYLMLVGIGQSPIVVVVAAVSIALQVYRARCEECVLAATFGAEYERYRAATGLLGRRVARQPTRVRSVDRPARRPDNRVRVSGV